MKEKIIRGIETCSNISAAISSLFLILIVVLILVEIFLRTLFKVSTLIADEYSAYFFVALVMTGLSRTLKDGAHIRITVITSLLSYRNQKILEAITTLIAIALCTFALFHAVRMVYDAYRLDMTADSISATPIFIPQIMIPVGFFLFDLQLIAILLRRLLSYPTPSC